MSPTTYISRIETFSAAHRLHSPYLSVEENSKVYGKCNSAHGHGHNYRVEVVIKGEVKSNDQNIKHFAFILGRNLNDKSFR
ncbi:9689_t:CDS:2 [Ambispora gerdemannii]|uniref:6-pyruvoyltetrahydropterin synthase n=1 Tax=Ambispora gerdemannii TaxID=144530 RepID=A0A9N8YPG2_9GLOM|nr:9689_t:CDS:2 [Ambispora gerdemannii]